MIDGQYRYEIARGLLDTGWPEVRDPALLFGSIRAADGHYYSGYGIGGSITGLPALLIARSIRPPSLDRELFFFSLTSAVFAAGAAGLLFLFYVALGVARTPAVVWTLVSAFATLLFPVATSVFDQPQHAFFLLASCFFGFLGARHHSLLWAAAGGLAAGCLLNFQESYALVVLPLAIATLSAPGRTGAACLDSRQRFAVFLASAGLGFAAWLTFNELRFGNPLFSGKGAHHPSAFGNPLIGLAGLLISPGKGLLFYSPPTILAVIGLRGLWIRAPRLALAIATTALVYLGLISSLTFFGGDWCWGPRYFVSVLPLLALGLPWVSMKGWRRYAVVALVAAGFTVQTLGISLDHHRFFYARGLPDFFWYDDPWFYFRDSALLSRPAEIAESLRDTVPRVAMPFRPGPYPRSVSYAVFGNPAVLRAFSPVWMRGYRVFWLPRPWPLWMAALPEEQRPIDLTMGLAVILVLASTGGLTLSVGLRSSNSRQAAGER